MGQFSASMKDSRGNLEKNPSVGRRRKKALTKVFPQSESPISSSETEDFPPFTTGQESNSYASGSERSTDNASSSIVSSDQEDFSKVHSSRSHFTSRASLADEINSTCQRLNSDSLTDFERLFLSRLCSIGASLDRIIQCQGEIFLDTFEKKVLSKI